MANEILKRTPTSSGNQQKWTWAAWVKLNSAGGSSDVVFSANNPSTGGALYLRVPNSGGYLFLEQYDSGYTASYYTADNETIRHRDPSSWLHVVFAVDTTRKYGEERVKIYVNGLYSKVFENHSVSKHTELIVNSLGQHTIGARLYNGSLGQYFEGQVSDLFFVDGQALTPDVFGYHKEGNGYISAGSTQTTEFRPGQWVPKAPSVVKSEINRGGGFGVNGYYLPMNDSSNFGADFHCTPNTIITLKGEDLPQPKNGAPTTTDNYISQLRTDPYASNLVLAVPGITGAPGVAYTDFSANIKGSGTNKVITANGNAGVAVTASYYGSALSFDGNGDFFSMPDNDDFNFGSGDFTVEAWIKTDTSNHKTSSNVFNQSVSGAASNSAFYFGAGWDGASLYLSTSGNSWTDNVTSSVGISTAGWVHQVWQRRGTYLELYTNGVNVGVKTNFSGTVYNSTRDVQIGIQDSAGYSDFDGYIQDLRVYKGVAKYKGGFDVPKPYTPVGMGTWRAVPDCAANNFATLNPLHHGTSIDESDGNLSATWSGSGWQQVTGTVGVSTGKWYWESVQTSSGNQMSGITLTGIGTVTVHMGQTTDHGLGYYGSNGNIYYNSTNVAYGATWGQNDIIGVAFNASDRKIEFFKNGASQGIQTGYSIGIRTEGTYTPSYAVNNSGNVSINFGQNPTFSGNVAAAGTFTDSNGTGLFKYEPPTDFLALCEDNLPTPAIANPGEYFKTVLYEGDGNSGKSVVGCGFTPDLVWIKNRDAATNHGIFDSVRGATFLLRPNITNAQASFGSVLTSFDSDGFSVSTDSGVNGNNNNHVAWCWQAGAGTTSTNSDGSIDSVVSVNQDAGFSIVEFDTTGSAFTLGHGLGKAPKFVIARYSEATSNWFVYHDGLDITGGEYIQLNVTNAAETTFDLWGSTKTTDSVVNFGGAWSTVSRSIAYCWAEIENFSKFGTYVGDDTTDNAFVYCGFKPAFVIIKNVDAADNWNLVDSSRQPVNPARAVLRANLTNAEVIVTNGSFDVDLLSNGFKIRGANSEVGDPVKYIFAAWAESPFTTANAK